jgi:hypothetical protein
MLSFPFLSTKRKDSKQNGFLHTKPLTLRDKISHCLQDFQVETKTRKIRKKRNGNLPLDLHESARRNERGLTQQTNFQLV